MRSYHFTGDVSQVAFGLSELEKEGLFSQSESGLPVEVRRGEGLCAEYDGKRAVLTCGTKCAFFRALGLLLEKEPQGSFRAEETPSFQTCGAMFDVSRNAVLKPEGFGFFIRRMALMGMNMAMLYMEDVYEVPGEPYFGWMRGRCTQEELRAMDDYAFAFGIEVIPAVQTLAHLEKALRWQVYADRRDTGDILLENDPASLELVERMLRAATAPFRSRRVHLGMDEAEGLGTGKYLQKNGYHPGMEILNAHLKSVLAVCRKLGLEPMIWSDMYLKLLSPDGSYYDISDATVSAGADLSADAPADVSLVYWDYYHGDRHVYDRMIEKHRRFPNNLIFAGGGWTWSSLGPNLGRAFDTTYAGLAAAKEAGVKEVFCTLWGDDGSETSYLCALPVLQLFAEYSWGAGIPSQEDVTRRFAACCGGDAADFWALRLFDETPGVEKGNPKSCNPAKYLLYQDALLGLFDPNAEGLPLESWYADLAVRMEDAAKRNPRYAALFAHYHTLACVLSRKALLGVKITAAYRAGDRSSLAKCAVECAALCDSVGHLRASWEKLWNLTCKIFGFEVIDIRLGALTARLQNAQRRILAYLAGDVPSLPELEEPRLFYDGRSSAGEFQAGGAWPWARIVSGSEVP